MKKSSKLNKIVMIDGMFMNSNSSNESNSSDEKYRISTVNLNFPNNNEEQIVTKQQQIIKTSPSQDSLTNHKDVNKDLPLEKTG